MDSLKFQRGKPEIIEGEREKKLKQQMSKTRNSDPQIK